MEPDEELFACAYCQTTVEKFPFADENGNKFCSPFCRRKAEEAHKDKIEAREADSPDSLPRKTG